MRLVVLLCPGEGSHSSPPEPTLGVMWCWVRDLSTGGGREGEPQNTHHLDWFLAKATQNAVKTVLVREKIRGCTRETTERPAK